MLQGVIVLELFDTNFVLKMNAVKRPRSNIYMCEPIWSSDKPLSCCDL